MRMGNAGAGGSRRAETRGGETGGRETRTSCGAAFANARSAGMTAPDDDIGRRPLVPPPMLCRGSVRVVKRREDVTTVSSFRSKKRFASHYSSTTLSSSETRRALPVHIPTLRLRLPPLLGLLHGRLRVRERVLPRRLRLPRLLRRRRRLRRQAVPLARAGGRRLQRLLDFLRPRLRRLRAAPRLLRRGERRLRAPRRRRLAPRGGGLAERAPLDRKSVV